MESLRPMVEALRAAVAEGQKDAAFRQAWADLRETCGPAIGAKGDLFRLVASYVAIDLRVGVVAQAMERVLGTLPFDRELWPTSERKTHEASPDLVDLLVEGVEGLLRDSFGTSLSTRGVRVLDPFAGGGGVVEGVLRRVDDQASKLQYDLFANEARLEPYLLTAERLEPFEGLCFANTLALPPRGATPGFDFDAVPNSERLSRQRDARIDVIVSDLRGGKVRATLEWAAERLGEGIVAFLTDGSWIDEPADAGLRARLEREFDFIEHLPEAGITLLVRHPSLRRTRRARIVYDGQQLEPTVAHVWRPEILREEWQALMPLVGARGLFLEGFDGAEAGHDTASRVPKARPVLLCPFVNAWRRPAKRGSSWPPDGPALVTLAEPFGALATTSAPDRRIGRVYPFRVNGRENVAQGTMARFRAAYGPGVTERDVFDYAVALLNHPGYRAVYHEDLRRGIPRVPLLEVNGLLDLEGPPVGPGTAFGTGWSPAGFYEEGTVPEYDDPFASPYSRADVEPGFLLFTGLGSALTHLQTFTDRIVGEPLERVAAQGTPRVSKGRAVVVWEWRWSSRRRPSSTGSGGRAGWNG